MQWYLLALRRYAEFSGRSRRKEYWFFALFNFIIGIVLAFVDGAAGLTTAGIGILGGLYSLAVLIPSFAVTFRRLHDTGKSGWWILAVLVPVIGWLALLVFMIQDGNAGANEYGPDPKGTVSTPMAAGVAG